MPVRTGADATLNFDAVLKAINVPRVKALPGNPADEQEVDFIADATNGVIWRLRYRAASTSLYKWEFVGGPPLFSEVTTSESTASVAYTDLATVGPSVTLPLGGDYDVHLSALMGNAGSQSAVMSYAIGGTAAADADATSIFPSAGAAGSNFSAIRQRRKTGLGAVALLAKYRATGSTATFGSRFIAVTPVRVG